MCFREIIVIEQFDQIRNVDMIVVVETAEPFERPFLSKHFKFNFRSEFLK